MEVKSEYFRCISNFIYSYENICDLEQVPVMKGEEGCRGSGRSGVWKERVSRRKVFDRWFSLNEKEKERLIRQLKESQDGAEADVFKGAFLGRG